MAQKNLRTDIIIGGKTLPSFNSLGDKLQAMGGIVSRISDKILEWEGESIEVYKDYQTLMLETEAALGSKYTDVNERAKVMQTLEEKTSEWAANSIFHTDDMARAVKEAAFAGWDLEAMLSGIPSAMNLAQAGGLSLASGLDYVIKALNATGLGTEDSAMFVDQLAKAAHSSATTVEELAEAIETMGATARFGNNTAELLTMLDVLAQNGAVGSQAGTLLRNSMLRLIAPTKKAGEAMAGLEVTAEELEELAADSGDLEKANALLEAQGFSAYDADGKLKPFLQTFRELKTALDGMSEEERNNVLASIFPTRTITGAMAMLEAATEDYGGLYDSILDSEGYAEHAARLQTSGLMGSTELMNSKIEEFKKKIGKELSGAVTTFQGTVSDLFDTLNSLPEDQLAGLATAATALGVAGPGMMIGGAAIKAIAALGPWGTAFFVAATGAAYLVGYLHKLNEIRFTETFGTMKLDTEALGEYVSNLTTRFKEEKAAMQEWSDAADGALQEYENASQRLSSALLTDALTHKQLTDEEKATIEGYGQQAAVALLNGIENARTRDLTFLDMLFGDVKTNQEADALELSFALENAWYDDLYVKAEEVGQTLRDKLSEALTNDGIITPEEREEIVNDYLDQMDQLMSEITLRENAADRYAQLHRAQSVSWESYEEFMSQTDERKQAELSELEELYHSEYGRLQEAYEYAVKNHTALKDANGNKFFVTGNEAEDDPHSWASLAKEFEREHAEARMSTLSAYSEIEREATDALFNGSKVAQPWKEVKGILADYQTGLSDYQATAERIAGVMNGLEGSEQSALERALDYAVEHSGGVENIKEMIAGYRANGLNRDADWWERLLSAQAFISRAGGVTGTATDQQTAIEGVTEAVESAYLTFARYGQMISAEDMQMAVDRYNELPEAVRKSLDSIIEELSETYNLSAIAEEYGGFGLDELGQNLLAAVMLRSGKVFNPEAFTLENAPSHEQREIEMKQAALSILNKELEQVDSAISEKLSNIANKGDWQDWWYSFTNGKSHDEYDLNQLYGERDALVAEIESEEENIAALQAQVDGVAEEAANMEIVVPIGADGGYEAMNEQMQLMQNRADSGIGVRVYTVGGGGVSMLTEYAEGGRATEASIFGEGDTAEWAIPEEHSERTAQLLDAARRASGFSWAELLSRNGGLNGDPRNLTVNTTYAPTINAVDAAGVEDALIRDKARVEQVVREAVKAALAGQRFRDSVEVYV